MMIYLYYVYKELLGKVPSDGAENGQEGAKHRHNATTTPQPLAIQMFEYCFCASGQD